MKHANRVLSTVLIFSILASMLMVSSLKPVTVSAAAAPVDITVDWSAVRSETTNKSFGLNGFKVFDPAVASSPTYIKNMEYMNVGFIRYHSKEATSSQNPSDSRNWVDKENKSWDKTKINAALSGFTAANNPTKLITISEFPSWMKTYKVLKPDGSTLVNLLDPSEYDNFANYCAELVRITNIEYGHNIKYWEPTNENDNNYYVKFQGSGVSDKLNELIEIYNRCAKAMKAVDPSIKVGGLSLTRPDYYDAVTRFVRGTLREGTLDFFSFHFYASGTLLDSDKYVYDRANTTDTTKDSNAKLSKNIRQILDRECPDRHIELFLNENNISWSAGNNDPRMSGNKGAVFDALCMAYSHDAGVDGYNAWNEKDGVYGKMDDSYNLRPSAHLYQMMNNYFIGERVHTTSSDEQRVVPFAVKDKTTGKKSYLLINRTGEVQIVSTGFLGWMPSAALIKQHQISAEGYRIIPNTWNHVAGQNIVLPADSVTVFTESEKDPSILPVMSISRDSIPGSIGSQNTTLNLSALGRFDWMAFGRSSVSSVDRKAAPSQTMNYARIGASSLTRITNTPGGYVWNDGNPLGSLSTKSTTGIMVTTVGDGFEFTVPADLEERTLYLHLSATYAKGKIEASISDNSMEPYVGYIDRNSTIQGRTVTLKFSSTLPGQTLTVRCTLDSLYTGSNRGFTLQSAALYAPHPNAVLSGSVSDSTDATINLTNEGVTTWGHWGYNGVSGFVDKNGGTVPITTVTDVGASAAYIINDIDANPIPGKTTTMSNSKLKQVTWSDGNEPNSSVAPVKNALIYRWTDNNVMGNGFEFTVPADTTKRQLNIYLGAFRARGKITATLSDNSYFTYTTGGDGRPDAVESKLSNALTKIVTINYRAAAAGQTLSIKFTPDYGHFNATEKVAYMWIYGIAIMPADGTPPTTPAGLSLVSKSSTTVSLQWDATTDDSGVIEAYNIYKNGVLTGTTRYFQSADNGNYPDTQGVVPPATSYTITGLTPNTPYNFTVKALDPYVNLSSASSTLSVTTNADTAAPNPPAGLKVVSRTATSIDLTWSDGGDDAMTTEYDIYVDGALNGSAAGTTYTVTGLTGNTTYVFSVRAKDAAGNISAASGITAVTDVTTPAAPANLRTAVLTKTSADLVWDAATDNMAVSGYAVYKDGVRIAAVSGTSFGVTGLNAGTAYAFHVVATDTSGNNSVSSNILNITTPADITPPAVPGNLNVVDRRMVTDTTTGNVTAFVRLNWNVSADDVKIAGYSVYKDSSLLATVAGNVYTIPDLSLDRTYVFSVQAKDASNNASGESMVTVSTDFTKPGAPLNLRETGKGETAVTLAWDAASDNVGVAGYKVYNGNTAVKTVTGTVYSSTIDSLSPFTLYTFKVTALDAAGNESDFSSSISVRTEDTSAPGAPANLRVTAKGETSVSLAWDAAADNVAVIGYKVYNGNTLLTTVTGAVYSSIIDNLSPYTLYTFRVSSFDAVGNEAFSSISVRTEDHTAPGAPANFRVTGKSEASVSLAWDAPSGFTDISTYRIYKGNTIVESVYGSVYSYMVTGLLPYTLYTFKVSAVDPAGNETAAGALTERTTDTHAPTPPTSLSLIAKTQTSAIIQWNPASDNVGVDGYRIYLGDIHTRTVASSVYSSQFQDLLPNTVYNFKVTAVDMSGLESPASNILSITTDAPPASRSTPASSTPAAPPASPVSVSANGTITVTPEIKAGTAVAKVDAKTLDEAFRKAADGGSKSVTIEIPKIEGAREYKQQLPAASFSSDAGIQQVKIVTPIATMVIPVNMFNKNDIRGAENVAVSVGIADTSNLTDEIRRKVDGKPVIELQASIDGKTVNWNNPRVPVTVTVDYSPSPQELRDAEHIVVWYVDGNGKVNPVPSGKYDPATGKVSFKTTHFSTYAVAFEKKTFNDISECEWARKQIDVLASKGIINGTSETTYTPGISIQRADVVLLVIRALELTAEPDTNFSDVDNDKYYYEAVGIAKKLGIINGVGENKLNPEEPISRQDMMVMVQRALSISPKALADEKISELGLFNDAAAVSPYAAESIAALVKAGLVEGSNNNIEPLADITRAEMAVLIYRIYNR